MNDEEKVEVEANLLCKYLSGKMASTSLVKKYGLALQWQELEPVIFQSSLRWRLKPISRNPHKTRLALMIALLETDPDFNQLFAPPTGLLHAWLSFFIRGVQGVMKGFIGRLLS